MNLKIILTAALSFCISTTSFSETFSNKKAPIRWKDVKQIMKNIQAPTFANRTYNVIAYGAKNDSTYNSLPAFTTAINECNKQGGGTVVVPKGIYYIKGPIYLKSDVNLHLEEGSRIEFSTNPNDYTPLVLTKWEGTELYNYSPLIYCYQSRNVAITGNGQIDGNGAAGFNKWKPKEKLAVDRLREMGNDSVPVYKRIFGEGWYLRPCMIEFFGCENVLIDGVKIYDSPFWTIHPLYCNNVIVRNVFIDSNNFNNDGCDPESSTNVLIENVDFHVGDDGIAIKSGRDNEGWKLGLATENVIIRNCHFARWAITIGSEMSGGVRNIFIENCKIDSCKNGIYFKSNLDRGGFFENLYMRNIKANICSWGLINFRTDYHGYRGGNYPTLFKNITIENVKCNRVDSVALMANGLPQARLYDITLRNIRVKKAPKAAQMKNIVNLQMKDVYVNGTLITKNDPSIINQ